MELAMIGMNYPAEYNQLALHFIVPPFRNMNMFKAPYWYNYEKVCADLNSRQTFGRVVPYEPLGLGEKDTIFMDAERRHKASLGIKDSGNVSVKRKKRSDESARRKLEKARIGEQEEEKEGMKMRL